MSSVHGRARSGLLTAAESDAARALSGFSQRRGFCGHPLRRGAGLRPFSG